MSTEPTIITEEDPFESIVAAMAEIEGPDVIIGEVQDKTKYAHIKDVPFPYIPSEQITVVMENGEAKVRDIAPAYITNLQQWEVSGQNHTLEAAMLSAKKEMLLNLVREMAFKVKGYEAPLAVSAVCPVDHVYFDRHRIIINEAQATSKYMDADGDRATVLFNKDHTKCVLVKFPITSQPLILNVLHSLPNEHIHGLTHEMVGNILTEYPVKIVAEAPREWPGQSQEAKDAIKAEWDKLHWDRRALRLKAHTEVPVGLMTNAWNSYDLWTYRDEPFESKIQKIYTDPQRALDIEDFGMKAVRKDGNVAAEADVLKFGASKALAYEYAWALTSASSIGGMNANQLEWVFNTNLSDLVTRIRKLDVKFREVNPSQNKAKPLPAIDGELILRLKKMGLIRWTEYPHADKTMPPSVMIYLSLPNGTPVALTDVKRDNNRDEGLTFAFLLSPIFDNVDLYDEEGELVMPASNKFEHPINHMAKMMSTFDSRIINPMIPRDDPARVTGYFPRSWEEFIDPKRSIKVAMLQKAIQEYCGIYGDPCPAYNQNGKPVPSQMAFGLIIRSVAIDYGRDMNELEMEEVQLKALKLCNYSEISSKSTSRRIRKYVLANAEGGFILAPTNVHPARPGKSRAQLQRTLKAVTMKVAVIRLGADTPTGSSKQILITPSGIAKQETNEAFLPQVFNTREAYDNYLKGYGKTEEQVPAKEVHFQTWTGERRMCWVISPKTGIKIGKLVDLVGNKFMPRKIKQVHVVGELVHVPDQGIFQENGDEIDLLFPVSELVDKYNHHDFLKNAVETTIWIDNKPVQAMVTDWTFYRTGSASENIPPRERRCNYRGIDSYPIMAALLQIVEDLNPAPVNLAFATALRDACLTLLKVGPRDEEMERLMSLYQ